MSDIWPYVFLALDLIVGAAAVWFYLWAVVWVVRRVRASRRAPSSADSREAPVRTVRRRCDTCGGAWSARPGVDFSARSLKLRRWVRRRRRRRKSPQTAWSARQGWSRCPSCLSTDVRDSRRQGPRRTPQHGAQEAGPATSQPDRQGAGQA